VLQRQIEELKARLTVYARFVEEMIEQSVKGIVEVRPQVLGDTIDSREKKVNETELELEEECTALIAQHQPRARELRTVLMVLGMTNDLERMGDHAVNIAEAGLALLRRAGARPPEEVPRLARETIRMVDQAIQAFVSEDVALARNVCVNDSVADDLATSILKNLVSDMARDSSTIEWSLSILKIAANLERIADLSTNVCEDVIYLAEGRVIKHHKEEEAR
jgi:phosphate transport system protein